MAAELEAYGPLVVGSYIVACDGIMQQVAGLLARGRLGRTTRLVRWEFLQTTPNLGSRTWWPFNEGVVRQRVSYWPQAYLRSDLN